MGFGFGIMNVIPILVILVFAVVIIMFIVMAVRGAAQWNRNNKSPVLTVEAEIVAKRADVTHHRHHTGTDGGMMHTASSTRYYATFQVESGDRMELYIPRNEYGLLAEGDRGRLTFQGTRYLSFERSI